MPAQFDTAVDALGDNAGTLPPRWIPMADGVRRCPLNSGSHPADRGGIPTQSLPPSLPFNPNPKASKYFFQSQSRSQNLAIANLLSFRISLSIFRLGLDENHSKMSPASVSLLALEPGRNVPKTCGRSEQKIKAQGGTGPTTLCSCAGCLNSCHKALYHNS